MHDFFTDQQQINASIIFLKNVLHDWSDDCGLKILKQLRGSATPNTKLICVEMILPYACHDTEEDSGDGITGLAHVKAHKPLLANWGAVISFIYQADVTVHFSA